MNWPLCFRQGKNLPENLRQTLRSLALDTHHIADVADLKFCLASFFFFDRRNTNVCIRPPFVLFGSQRCNRIDPGGAIRREETSKKRRNREHQTCADQRKWIGWTYVIQDFGQDPPSSERKKKADADSQSCLHRALSHNKGEDVASMCAQCHADSDLS